MSALSGVKMDYTYNQYIVVQEQLIPLFDKAGLDLDLWSVEFTRRKTRAGSCDYTKKMLYFSNPILEAEGPEKFYPTVIHEVAHAVVMTKYDGFTRLLGIDPHGEEWRQVYVWLGGRYEDATASRELRGELDYLWVGYCPNGHTAGAHRVPRSLKSCGVCAPMFSREFLYTWYKRGELVPMPDVYIARLNRRGLPNPYPVA